MIEQVRREISRALAGVRGALRARLQAIDLAKRIQRIQAEGLAGEILQGVELMQQFGFTSALPADAQLIVLPLGGRSSAAVIVASEHGAYRLQLGAQGECAIYNQWGDQVYLKADRSILVKAALKVRVESPLAEFTGRVTIAGTMDVTGAVTTGSTIDAAGDIKGQGTSLHTHTHGGVQPGGSNTGAPV